MLVVTANNFSCVHMHIFFKHLFWSINCFLYVRPQVIVLLTSFLFHRISRWLCVRLSFKVWNKTVNTFGYLCVHSLAKLRYNYIPESLAEDESIIHMVNYACVQKGVQFKYKFKYIGTWWPAAWPPPTPVIFPSSILPLTSSRCAFIPVRKKSALLKNVIG